MPSSHALPMSIVVAGEVHPVAPPPIRFELSGLRTKFLESRMTIALAYEADVGRGAQLGSNHTQSARACAVLGPPNDGCPARRRHVRSAGAASERWPARWQGRPVEGTASPATFATETIA